MDIYDRLISKANIAAPRFGALSGFGLGDSANDAVVRNPGVPAGAVILVLTSGNTSNGPPAGWALLDSSGAGSVWNAQVFTKIAAQSEPPVWLFPNSATAAAFGWTVVWWLSAGGVNAHAIAASASGTQSPSANTTVAGCQIVTFGASDFNGNDVFTIDAASTVLSAEGNKVATTAIYDTAPQAAAGATTRRTLTPVTSTHVYLATVAIAP
jgi:hypothetical protein